MRRFLARFRAVGVFHRIAAIGLVAGQENALIPRYRDAAKEPHIVAATRWIEEHQTDAIPIHINGPYLQHFADVYDPTETAQSKRISRTFIFDRFGQAFPTASSSADLRMSTQRRKTAYQTRSTPSPPYNCRSRRPTSLIRRFRSARAATVGATQSRGPGPGAAIARAVTSSPRVRPRCSSREFLTRPTSA
jgi:hypothetical protein